MGTERAATVMGSYLPVKSAKLAALKKGQSQKNRVLYVVCARSAHTTYTPSFPLKRLFSAESKLFLDKS